MSFFVFQLTSSLHSAHQFASMVTLMIFVLLCPGIGLQITVYSLEETVKFLRDHGFQYVLTSKFKCMLRVQENKFRTQRSMATSITPKANTKGSKRPKEGITVTTSALKKQKKRS